MRFYRKIKTFINFYYNYGEKYRAHGTRHASDSCSWTPGS